MSLLVEEAVELGAKERPSAGWEKEHLVLFWPLLSSQFGISLLLP